VRVHIDLEFWSNFRQSMSILNLANLVRASLLHAWNLDHNETMIMLEGLFAMRLAYSEGGADNLLLPHLL
jgi:hypothetical protein